MKPVVQLIWFKKDLRVTDHQPIWEAAQTGIPTLAVFLFEPSLMAAPDSSFIHWRFAAQGVFDLKQALKKQGIQLLVLHAEFIPFFERLLEYVDVKIVYSHCETGNQVSFNRDKQVAAYFKTKSVVWKEYQRDGVVRRLKSRENWPANWYQTMHNSLFASASLKFSELRLPVPFLNAFEIPDFPIDDKARFQPGGRQNGLKYLNSFLQERVVGYVKHISKPAESRRSCSRLSPYLAWGMLSMREVYQAVERQKKLQPERGFQLKFFQERLRWHCHFIQKFETECRMEFHNLNPVFNQVRTQTDERILEAWKAGATGFPLVDACMRCLKATGYINFRMRAMLVSFITHNCWQPWQAIAPYLAQLFLDYEPGIHYPQIQMQAGSSGTHIIRTYDVVKQSYKQDPMGNFIRLWVEELKDLPLAFVHEPWKLSREERMKCIPSYPEPVVDLKQSRQFAQQELWVLKKTKQAKENNQYLLNLLTNQGS